MITSLLLAATLTVQGSTLFQKPADELSLSIGVISEASTADQGLKDNNEKMRALIEILKEVGLTTDEYKTGRFSIRPLYTQSPQNPSPSWRPTIFGYEVSNALEIKTSQLNLAGSIIDRATKAGANTIASIRFGLQDPRTHRTEAINRATANAFDDARALARASKLKLLNVQTVTLDEARTEEPVFRASFAKEMQSVPLEPGEVDVQANVTVTWQVEDE